MHAIINNNIEKAEEGLWTAAADRRERENSNHRNPWGRAKTYGNWLVLFICNPFQTKVVQNWLASRTKKNAEPPTATVLGVLDPPDRG